MMIMTKTGEGSNPSKVIFNPTTFWSLDDVDADDDSALKDKK